MKLRFALLAAGVAMLVSNAAQAEQLLGEYRARISDIDHRASDGYPLDSAAQMVRQDRANWHKFGRGDAEDEDDRFFGSTESRARFERMLNRSSAMSQATRRAIVRGEPVVEVQVYRNSVTVRLIGD